MKFTKIACIIMCIALMLYATACKSNSTSSDVSVITEVHYEDETNTDSSDSDRTSSDSSVTSSETSEPSTSSDDGDDESEEEENLTMEEKYGFNTLRNAEYYCVKDIPYGDAEYEIAEVLTDKGTDVCYMTELVCNESDIKIDGKKVTVPHSYRDKHDSLTLYARHRPTGIECEIIIAFDEWELYWSDEFNGTEIDFTKWDYSPNYYRDKGYANTWKDDMSFVDGKGHFVSRAIGTGEVNDEGKAICYSGALWSKDLFEHSYGYYEVSAKLHHATGMWGAFWIVAGDMDEKDPPSDNTSENGAEIDIFESLYNYGGVSHALHWDGWQGNTKSSLHKGYVTHIDTFDNEFHTFALRWSPEEYVFLVDGQVTRRMDNTNGICNQPGYINLTTECGTWGEEFTLGKGEYSDMLIDYVRVYTTPSDF